MLKESSNTKRLIQWSNHPVARARACVRASARESKGERGVVMVGSEDQKEKKAPFQKPSAETSPRSGCLLASSAIKGFGAGFASSATGRL